MQNLIHLIIMCDVAKILKNCPPGTKLYSPAFSDVTFNEVFNYTGREDIISVSDGKVDIHFHSDGRYSTADGAECQLFPHKDCREWDRWRNFLLWSGMVVKCQKDGKVYILSEPGVTDAQGRDYSVFGMTLDFASKEERETFFQTLEENGRVWNAKKSRVEKKYVDEAWDDVKKAEALRLQFNKYNRSIDDIDVQIKNLEQKRMNLYHKRDNVQKALTEL